MTARPAAVPAPAMDTRPRRGGLRTGPHAGAGWPGLCAVCRGWGRLRLCDTCRVRWAPRVARCLRCAIDVPAGHGTCAACALEPPAFDAASAALDYAPPWDALVAAFKFHGALDLAPTFAELMLAARADDERTATCLVPVPLSAARLRERGYNQAWELARRLARARGARADPRLVLRVRDTPHQLALAPGRRAANVRGAFAVEPTRLAAVRGRAFTIVDDVMTTGATAAEVARVLRQAGAARVDVWVLARTPHAEAPAG